VITETSARVREDAGVRRAIIVVALTVVVLGVPTTLVLIAANTDDGSTGAPNCVKPTPPSADTTPPHAAANPPSPNIAPIERLGLWNGTAFQSITAPGTISNGHLYVLVHGWQAGLLDAVNGFPGPGPLLIWDPQAVTPTGASDVGIWLAPMAQALTKLDPAAVVVAYSWLDDAATGSSLSDAKDAESETVPNGQRLAAVLNEAISTSFAGNGGEVHVIGHSFGSKVATIASLGLTTPPRQLTLMDSPDISVVAAVGASNDLVPYLRTLKIGRGASQTFVDNYTSIFGCAYGLEKGLDQVVDVRLVPSQYKVTDVQDKHLYPPKWYTAAALDPQAGVGPEWSPLLGSKYTSLGLAYVQTHPGDIARQLALTRTGPT
jgi:hypothetical protein